MTILDIFSNDAFSVTSLTDAINKMPYKPGQVGGLGIFRESGVATTSIMADEVQGVREFGSESNLQSVQTVVNDRLGELADKHDYTLEHLRLGAIKGQILDEDGSTVLYDLFDEFGVTAYDAINFDLANTAAKKGAIKVLCHGIKRKIENELGQVSYTEIHAFCSPSFFDALVTHDEVTKAYDRFQESVFLRTGQARGQFDYAGIVFEEYHGSSDCSIADGEVHFFPVGAQGLFRQYNAPADFVETVNTIGLPRYAKQAVDDEFGRWVKLHTQANPLPLCTRPKVLIKGKAAA